MSDEQGLFVTATPIGNLGDISARALDVLRRADLIACEDTRVTRKLLQAYDIDTPTTAYHEHNADKAGPQLLVRLTNGDTIALVSDAGTPLVSDPGYRLVSAAIEAGILVRAIPGPSALLAALVVSGLPSDHFCFQGFLPNKKSARRTTLQAVKTSPGTQIFFESGHRVAASLADMADVMGDQRQAAVCRELTKMHEETSRGTLVELAAQYAMPNVETRGEFVVLVGPPPPADAAGTDEIDDALKAALSSLSVREAAQAVAYITGAPRRQIYQRALELKKDEEV